MKNVKESKAETKTSTHGCQLPVTLGGLRILPLPQPGLLPPPPIFPSSLTFQGLLLSSEEEAWKPQSFAPRWLTQCRERLAGDRLLSSTREILSCFNLLEFFHNCKREFITAPTLSLQDLPLLWSSRSLLRVGPPVLEAPCLTSRLHGAALSGRHKTPQSSWVKILSQKASHCHWESKLFKYCAAVLSLDACPSWIDV